MQAKTCCRLTYKTCFWLAYKPVFCCSVFVVSSTVAVVFSASASCLIFLNALLMHTMIQRFETASYIRNAPIIRAIACAVPNGLMISMIPRIIVRIDRISATHHPLNYAIPSSTVCAQLNIPLITITIPAINGISF